MFFWRVYEFSFDFGWISGKMDEISKFQGPTPQRRDPMQQRRSMPRHGMSMPQRSREGGLDKPWVRRGVAKLHRGAWKFLCFVLFCFSIASRTCLLD